MKYQFHHKKGVTKMNKVYDKKEFLRYMTKRAKEMYPGELSYRDMELI